MADCGTWMFNPGKPCCEEGRICRVPSYEGARPRDWGLVSRGYFSGRTEAPSNPVVTVLGGETEYHFADYEAGVGYWRTGVLEFESDRVIRLDRDGDPSSIGPGTTGCRVFFRLNRMVDPAPGISQSAVWMQIEVQVVYMTAFIDVDPSTGQPWPSPAMLSQGFLDARSDRFDLGGPSFDEDEPSKFLAESREFTPFESDGKTIWHGRSVVHAVETGRNTREFDVVLRRLDGQPLDYQVDGEPAVVASASPSIFNDGNLLFSLYPLFAFTNDECCRVWCATCGCDIDPIAEIEDENGVWRLTSRRVEGSDVYFPPNNLLFSGTAWKPPAEPSGRPTPYTYEVYCCEDGVAVAVVNTIPAIPFYGNQVRRHAWIPKSEFDASSPFSLDDQLYYVGQLSSAYAVGPVDPCTGKVKFDRDSFNSRLGLGDYARIVEARSVSVVLGGVLRTPRRVETRPMICGVYPLPRKRLVMSWSNPRVGDGSMILARPVGRDLDAVWVGERDFDPLLGLPRLSFGECEGWPGFLRFSLSSTRGLSVAVYAKDGCDDWEPDQVDVPIRERIPAGEGPQTSAWIASDNRLDYVSGSPLVLSWDVDRDFVRRAIPDDADRLMEYVLDCGFTNITITEESP